MDHHTGVEDIDGAVSSGEVNGHISLGAILTEWREHLKPGKAKRRAKQTDLPETLPKAWGRFLRLAVMLLLVVSFQASGMKLASAQSPGPSEYAVKAAFLFHFAQFVEWPDGAFGTADSPLVYCTIGEDPFQGALDASLKDKTIGTRAIQVRHLKKIQEALGCHLVFIGEEDQKEISAKLAALQGSPILTVGESGRFVEQGGMIAFCIEEKKIRFEINLESAERAKLKISSRLLTLAKAVIGKPKRG